MAKKKPSGRNIPAAKRLSKKELNETRQRLLERRSVLLSGAKQEYTAVHAREKGLQGDSFDVAQEVADESVSRGILATAEEEVGQINAALERIDNGAYGLCEVCTQPIPKERLKIVPYATMCVKCKSELEGENGSALDSYNLGIIDDIEDDEAAEDET